MKLNWRSGESDNLPNDGDCILCIISGSGKVVIAVICLDPIDDETSCILLDDEYGDDLGFDWEDVEWWLPVKELAATIPQAERSEP